MRRPDLSATGGTGQVGLTWDNVGGVTWKIYRGTSSNGESGTAVATGVATNSYTDTGLDPNTTYYYKIKATNGVGDSVASAEANATTDNVAPNAPTGVVAIPGASAVTIAWTAASGATSYKVYRGTSSNGESGTPLGTPSTTYYVDSTASNGTQYFYKVKAHNAVGDSSNSSEVSATPDAKNAIFVLPTWVAAAKAKLAGSAAQQTQMAAFKSRLTAVLPLTLNDNLGGSYQGAMLQWIASFAAGYLIWLGTDNAFAFDCADKALGLMASAVNDWQGGQTGSPVGRTFAFVGNGSTNTFTMPYSDWVSGSLEFDSYPTTELTPTKGTGSTSQDDLSDNNQYVLSVTSATGGGGTVYVQDVDWAYGGAISPRYIKWLGTANRPSNGATYYVKTANFNVNPSLITFTNVGAAVTLDSTPDSSHVVFYECVHGTRASDFSTNAYQQTGRGQGGGCNGLIDSGYSQRYLGYAAIGHDWLYAYPGYSSALKTSLAAQLVTWAGQARTATAEDGSTYLPHAQTSNYGAGRNFGRACIAAALNARDATNGPTLTSDLTGDRTTYYEPMWTADTNPNFTDERQLGTVKGGAWWESYNYGILAIQNTILMDAVLSDAGLIGNMNSMAAWASDAGRAVLQGGSDSTNGQWPGLLPDFGGDGYAYPSAWSSSSIAGLAYTFSTFADDADVRSYYANIAQYAPTTDGADHTFHDWKYAFFYDPDAATAYPSGEPTIHRSTGSSVVFARQNWTSTSTHLTFFGGQINRAAHGPTSAGHLAIARGADHLFLTGSSYTQDQAASVKTCENNCVVIDDGGAAQTYRYAMSSSPGANGPNCLGHENAAGYAYESWDYKANYYLQNSDTQGPASELVRSWIYDRTNSLVFVHDRVATDAHTYTKQIRWHAEPSTMTLTSGRLTVANGGSKAAMDTFSSTALTRTKGNATAPFDGTNLSATSPVYDQLISTPTSAVARLTHVSSVQVGASALTVKAATFIQGASLEGVQIGDVVDRHVRNGRIGHRGVRQLLVHGYECCDGGALRREPDAGHRLRPDRRDDWVGHDERRRRADLRQHRHGVVPDAVADDYGTTELATHRSPVQRFRVRFRILR
jgi:hypothetical protein